jgi:diguanylate cyclase (GGDEF)-like protein
MKILILVLIITNLFLLAKMLKYRKASLQDEFSLLPNHQALNNYLKKNNKEALNIAIIDIDNFKEFNKICISKGDEVLKEFAEVLKQKLSEKAFISRYRFGDEFALVFSTNYEVEKELNNLKDFFKNHQMNSLPEMPNYRIGFCYGISFYENDEKTYSKRLENAEFMLAMKKRENVRN